MLKWICLYLLVSQQFASVSSQTDDRASQWLGNFTVSTGSQDILCLGHPVTASYRLRLTAENTGLCHTCCRGEKLLHVARSCVAEDFWLPKQELETRSELKIRKHHQHSEKGGVSLTVCMHVLDHRGAAHTPYKYTQYTKYTNTSYVNISLKFPPSCVCQGLYFPLSGVCVISMTALGWLLLS